MVFPPIHWFMGIKGKSGRLSDIEFLSKKEFDGKLRTTEAFSTATGDLVTLTANSGKDMYLARAKVTLYLSSGGTSSSDKIELSANGTVIETITTSLRNDSTNGAATYHTYEFKNIGLKVAATQIIKVEIIALDSETEVEGFLSCFEETTGEDPTI